MVKTFSSEDAVVWIFLTGTRPSQRPVALSFFFSTMSMSIFQLTHRLHIFSFYFDSPKLLISHVLLILTLIFIYDRMLMNCWHTWVSCILHLQTECNYYYYTTLVWCYSVPLNLPVPLLTPLFFHHPFHATPFTGRTKLAHTKTTYSCL